MRPRLNRLGPVDPAANAGPQGNEVVPSFVGHFMLDKLEKMILEARSSGAFMRAFDVRYATEGIPELGEDYLYFPPGSFEVLETGNLQGPSTSTQPLKYGKLLPLNAILLVELADPHK